MSRHPQDEAQRAALRGAPAASPPLQSEPDRAYIRLELVRLVHRHDHTKEQIVERAQALESYVLGDQAADKP